MIGLSINESTRAAALDGALSFSILVQNQRELTLKSAQSSVTGLLTAIRAAPANLRSLIDTASAASAQQDISAQRLTQPAWKTAPSGVRNTISDTLSQSFEALIRDAETQARTATDAASAARDAADNPSAERSLADTLENEGQNILAALIQLENGNEAAALTTLANARAAIADSLDDARDLLATLQAQTPAPAGRIADTEAVIAAAESLLDAANQADATARSPLASAYDESPTTYELGSDAADKAYITSWGDSGRIAITDDSGRGILISPDGKVDALPPSGDGWQFQNDATFLLPGGIKVSISPGSPASVLATRGEQSLSLANLAPGQNPAISRQSTGGRAADTARNDGHLFVMGADPRAWTLAGAPLGDTPGNREVVATAPLTNEELIDVTLTDIPPSLIAELQALGVDINAFDTDQDGKLNSTEWQSLVATLDSAISASQRRFDQALGTTNAALEALLKLNQFIEKTLDEADRRQNNRQQVSSEERDQLQQIQRDLVAALEALRQADRNLLDTSPPQVTDVLTAARVVLNQLDAPPPPPASPSPTPPLDTAPPAPLNNIDPLGATPPLQPPTTPVPPPGTTPPTSVSTTEAGPLNPTPQTPPALPPGFPATEGVPLAPPPALSPTPISPNVSILGTPQASPDSAPLPEPAPGPQFFQPTPPSTLPESAPQLLQSFRRAERLLGRLQNVPPAFPTQTPPSPTPAVTEARPVTPPPTEPVLPTSFEAKPTPASGIVRPPPATPVVAANAIRPEPAATSPILPPPPAIPSVPPPSVPAPEASESVGQNVTDASPTRVREQQRSQYQDQLARSENLQTQVRHVVERFLTLVLQDADLRQVFQADDLTDTQRDTLKEKTQTLERELGLTWGGDPGKTPQADATLATRMLTSGMKI
jgi:hypothetical protein